MAFTQDFPVARARLQWTAWGLVLCMALNLTRQLAGFHPVLLTADLALIAVAAAVAELTRRGRITTLPQVNLCGGVLAGLLSAITLVAYVVRHEPMLLVMLSLQFVAVGALFFSTRWLLSHLVATTIAAVAVTGFKPYGLLVSTSAVLGLTIHMAIRDRQGRRDSVHAAKLEAALELARHQLHDKERAESERETALQDSARFQEQLLQSQKMEAIGTLAGGLAHDMNNALAGILGLAECIASAAPDDQIREDAEQIMQSAQRAADLTRNLLGFSRRGQYRSERMCAEPLVASVVALIRRTLPKGVTVATSIAEQLAAFDGDASLLSHALVNLCINASDAMSGHGTLEVGASAAWHAASDAPGLQLETGHYVVLSVRDTGSGMDAATRARIFEPFFTTKEPGRGTGLGLAMVYGTVQRHCSAIAVDSELGRGTTFRIYLPAAAAPSVAAAPKAPSQAIATRRSGHVLVVDDEPVVRSLVERVLQRAGYSVVVAADGQIGLDMLARERGRFDLVLLDMAMPRMAGAEMFRFVRAAYPELPVVLMSGYSSPEDIAPLLAGGALDLVEKPFLPDRLLEAVGAAIQGHAN
jgi:signal transduction histidine kinase/ActR/RegA family two-component response regulator